MADQYFVDIVVTATGRVCRTTPPMPLDKAAAALEAKTSELANLPGLMARVRLDDRKICTVCQSRMTKLVSMDRQTFLGWKCEECEKEKHKGDLVRGKSESWGT